MNFTYEATLRPYDGPWWQERSAYSKLDRIAVPVMSISRPLSLTLFASSSRIDTAFFVKIFDVAPDGAKRVVSRGLVRASFCEVDAKRSSPGQPFHPFNRQLLLEPDRVYEFQIELVPMFHTFRTGHRLQLEIASEDLQYNNPLRQIDVQVLPWPVENTVHHDAAAPSHLLVPIEPDAPELMPVEPPLRDIEWPLPPGQWLSTTENWPLVPE